MQDSQRIKMIKEAHKRMLAQCRDAMEIPGFGQGALLDVYDEFIDTVEVALADTIEVVLE